MLVKLTNNEAMSIGEALLIDATSHEVNAFKARDIYKMDESVISCLFKIAREEKELAKKFAWGYSEDDKAEFLKQCDM